MNFNVNTQTLIGLFSATGLPPLFKAIISFFHPSIYTLACNQAYIDGTTTSCLAADHDEAILWLVLSAVAIAYGLFMLARYLKATTPTNTALVKDQTTGQMVQLKTFAAPGDIPTEPLATKQPPNS